MMWRIVSFFAMALLASVVFYTAELSEFLGSVTGGPFIYASPFIALSIITLIYGSSVRCLAVSSLSSVLALLAHYAVASILLYRNPGDPNIGLGFITYSMPVALLFAAWLGYQFGMSLDERPDESKA